MDERVKKALLEAMDIEFAWQDNFENPESDYTFSKAFDKRMKLISGITEHSYVSLGSKRIRKAFAIALVALFLMLATGCAFITGQIIVKWNEKQNDKIGALDIDFDVETKGPISKYKNIEPDTPKNYTITYKNEYSDAISIEYTHTNGNQQIGYSQQILSEGFSMFVDNEENALTQTTVNGYKGYNYNRDGVYGYIWTDGISVFQVYGNCPEKLVDEMVAQTAKQ